MRSIITKTTMSLPTGEIFQVHGENRPVANLPVVNFVLSHQLRNFRFLFFVFWFSSPVCKRYRFFSVLAAGIRENSNKQP